MKIYNQLYKDQIYLIILIFSLVVCEKVFSKDRPDIWKFTLKPIPMLVISGNIEKSNLLFHKNE